MQLFLSEYSLVSLFFLGFAAATILPIGSEWLLIVLVTNGYSVAETTVVATAGNYLGACTTYAVGWWGSDFLISKIFRISQKNVIKAKRLYAKWGSWSLLFTWLPVIGDPLCLAAGGFRSGFHTFSVLVVIGKGFRYLFVALTASALSLPY